MNGLLLASKEEQMPIELMYISRKGDITHRTVIVKKHTRGLHSSVLFD